MQARDTNTTICAFGASASVWFKYARVFGLAGPAGFVYDPRSPVLGLWVTRASVPDAIPSKYVSAFMKEESSGALGPEVLEVLAWRTMASEDSSWVEVRGHQQSCFAAVVHRVC